jgi:hypothetical protein
VAVTSEDEFKAWLEMQPQAVCVAIAHRAAMRVLPLAALAPDDDKTSIDLALATFRGSLTSGVAAVGPTPDVKAAAIAAAIAANAAYAASDAANAAAIAAGNADTDLNPERLMAESIEVSPEVRLGIERFAAGKADLLRAGGPWEFWARWYDRAMAGDPLPWDLQEQVALIPNEVWEAGPEAVAKEIAKIEAALSPSRARPDTVPEIERAILRQLVQGLLSAPQLTADFAASSAETIDRATQEYLNRSGENCLPEEFAALDALPGHFRRIGALALQDAAAQDAIVALEAEIEALNGAVARLEADLQDARKRTLDGRFKAAAIENLAKTVTSPWMIGAVGYGVCHFFGWTPSSWTLAHLRGYAEDLLKALPKN